MALFRCGNGNGNTSFANLADMVVDESVECGNGTTYSVTAKTYDRLMVWNGNSGAPKTSVISNVVGNVVYSNQITLSLAVAGTPDQKVRFIFIPAGATLDISSNSTSGNPYDNTRATFYKFN